MGERARVAVVFDDGSLISSFLSIHLRRTYTDPLDHFQFEVGPRVEDGSYLAYREKLGKGNRISLFINDVLQGDYLVETGDWTISKEKGAHGKLELKNLLCTAYEGNVDPDFSLSPSGDTSIGSFLLKVFSPFGFTTVVDNPFASVSIQTGKPIKPGGETAFNVLGTLKHAETTAHEGEAAYKFAARIVTRLGFAIHITPNNQILIDRPDYTQDTCATIVAVAKAGSSYPGADYAHGDIHVHESNAHQHSFCEVRGQQAMQLGTTATARPLTRIEAKDVIPKLSVYRSSWAPLCPLYFRDKSSGSNAHTANVCALELGMRAKDAYQIKLQVNGWVSATGVIYQPGLLVRLVHELDGIDQPFFILECTRALDKHQGEITSFQLIPAGSLILGKPNT